MASISSAGIGSGLDVENIITQLMTIEKKPLTALQTQASVLDSKISAFGTVKSQLATLSDAVSKLALPATWNAKTAGSSNAAAVSATVSGGADASAGTFSVSVTQLAKAQSVASAAVASGAGVGSGTLQIELGTWAADPDAAPGATPARTFQAGSAAAVSVRIESGDSMEAIAARINAAGAGVSATVLKDVSGDRLMLRSSATGEAAGFRVTAADDGSTGGAGLGVLAFDDPAGAGGMAANPIQYGQNARATINGIEVQSASNTLDDTIPGLSLTLSQVTTTPAEVTTAIDAASMRSAITAFVTAYNATNQMFNAATSYDASTKTAALLQGDATTVGLQNAMRSMVGAISGGGGALQRLSDLGISIARDGAGNLAIDDTRLDKALKDPAAVQHFFAAPAGANDAATGFATRFGIFTQAATGSSGTLAAKTTSLQTQKTANTKDQEKVGDRLTLTEARLRKQYAALDTTMSSLSTLNTYITQQIAQWNKSTS